MPEVVTGDAVVLDVAIAQLPVRAVGALIDVAVVFVGYLLGVMLWAATLTQFDPALSSAVLVIFTALVLIGYPLIQVDELVDLRPGQPAAVLDQVLEPIPGGAVGQHERVDVHAAKPSSLGRYARGGDRRRGRP